MHESGPMLIVDRFSEALAALLERLSGLSEEWDAPTHLAPLDRKGAGAAPLGGDVGILSCHRGG